MHSLTQALDQPGWSGSRTRRLVWSRTRPFADAPTEAVAPGWSKALTLASRFVQLIPFPCRINRGKRW